MIKPKTQPNQPAFVTLVSVIILGAVSLVMVTSNLAISTESVLGNSAVLSSIQASTLANTCAEIALTKLKDNTSYVGNETINIDSFSCTIATITGTGNTNRTINTTATVNNSKRNYTVVVATVNPDTVITSWQEV